MIAAIALAALQPAYTVTRLDYGVPHVKASGPERLGYGMGVAQAEDRLWQMELSRRSARGTLAELLGPSAVGSDREVLRFAYTDEEMEEQIGELPGEMRLMLTGYAQGVTATMEKRHADGTLPEGYQGQKPAPWDVKDSAAIGIMLMRQFGSGGSGELRNYALLRYLELQPVKDQRLDVFDDIGWFNVESPVTTGSDDDLSGGPHRIVDTPTRTLTEAHLDKLPKTSLFELAPAAAIAGLQESKLIAQQHGIPHKTGSYAIVVGPEFSKTGNPMLLSAPQMGHTSPSVITEAVIETGDLKAAGMAVPGLPLVLIGNTPQMAWGFTTGVNDLTDVFVSELDGESYKFGSATLPIETITFTRKVKGGEDFTVTQERTRYGPVVLKSRGSKALYSQKSVMRGRELVAFSFLPELYRAQGPDDIADAVSDMPVGFNAFYAFTSGDYGWHFTGQTPIRATGIDPRLPTPGAPENEWQGYLSADQMPHSRNPSKGRITNWNNKPAAWWPNLDTPAFGELNRVSALNLALPKGKLGRADLERAAWEIARRDEDTMSAFMPLLNATLANQSDGASAQFLAFDGWLMQGSAPAAAYANFVNALRTEVFAPKIGNLTNPSLFRQAIQPSLIFRAMSGKTKFDWLGQKAPTMFAQDAVRSTTALLAERSPSGPASWGYRPGTMPDPSGPRIPYNNRGTYIQITELTPTPAARSVASPGVAESGPHSADQAPLARAWTYKPMLPLSASD